MKKAPTLWSGPLYRASFAAATAGADRSALLWPRLCLKLIRCLAAVCTIFLTKMENDPYPLLIAINGSLLFRCVQSRQAGCNCADHREDELPCFRRYHVLDNTERRVKPGHTRRSDEGQSNQQTRPDRTDQHEQALSDCQCQTGGDKTDDDAAEPASPCTIGPDACFQADEERQGSYHEKSPISQSPTV